MMNFESIADVLNKNPQNLAPLSSDFSDFMKEVHSYNFVDDEDFRDQLEFNKELLKQYHLDFEADEFYKLKQLLDIIPESTQFSHGDFHFGNVLLQNHELLLLDMTHAGVGHPIFDLATLYNNTIYMNELLRKYPYIKKYVTSLKNKDNIAFFDNVAKSYYNLSDEDLEKLKRITAVLGPFKNYYEYRNIYNSDIRNPVFKMLYKSILKFNKKRLVDGIKNLDIDESIAFFDSLEE